MIEVELSEVFKMNLFLFLQSHLKYSAKAIIFKIYCTSNHIQQSYICNITSKL